MMVRRQIQFTDEQLAELRREAERREMSVSAIVREAVDRSLRERHKPSREELIKRSLAAAGRFRSGTGDVARRHDEYFGDEH